MLTVSSGTRLGPYEIVSAIGSGGMGEVFRARDARLGRDVALKVLPGLFAADPDRLQRFEQEARASAALNHPNIVVVHDVGSDRGVSYVVSELLDGETLRQALDRGALPARKAADYAVQIANGLAAAHERGIVHRDLKPENVFITRDGRAKILDFGLAKVAGPVADDGMQPTTVNTDPGTVLGTAGYMSPEQLRGESVDHRSDIFSLGAMLYEMFSGTRAFRGKTAVDTISAILKEDPADFPSTATSVSPAVERVIRRCLEKNPAERFQSARDLTFALDAVSTASGSQMLAAVMPEKRRSIGIPVLVAAALAVGVIAFVAGVRLKPSAPPVPSFKQLTFRAGTIRGARFAPDGKTVVYGAAWEGRPIELFSTRVESSESSTIALPQADVFGISASGEMAVALRATAVGPFGVSGTLARAPLVGGAARELIEGANAADWSANGRDLAIIRRDDRGMFYLEYPIGTEVLSARYWLSDVRISPDQSALAFIAHPFGGDEGSVELVDAKSKQRRALSTGWMSIQGLAWHPEGREVWFTATKAGGMRAIWAVSLAGVERLVLRTPDRLTLHDIAADGRVLVSGGALRSSLVFGSLRDRHERDLAWFDWSTGATISADARTVAFNESGEGAGAAYGVYIRPTDGSAAVRLGDGGIDGISPDGKWVLAYDFTSVRSSVAPRRLLPTGPGQARNLDLTWLERVDRIRWFPDSTRIVVIGNERGHDARSFEVAIADGAHKPMTPEGVTGSFVSPDSKYLTTNAAAGQLNLFPLAGGTARAVPIDAGESVAGWTSSSRELLVRSPGPPVIVTRIDIETGRRTPLATLAPQEPAGVLAAGALLFAPDGDHYVINYFRSLSELFVVEGLR